MKKKNSRKTDYKERLAQIRAADDRVVRAIHLRKVATDKHSHVSWKAAAIQFRMAATCYRQAGLGLLARQQWLAHAECSEALGEQEAAATSRQEAASIPAYWEDEQ